MHISPMISRLDNLICVYFSIVIIYCIYVQGYPQADIEAERIGVVWAEFVIDFLPTSTVKAEGATLPKRSGENTDVVYYCVVALCVGRGGRSAEGAWGEH